VSPAGSPPHISTAQQPGGRTGEPPEYAGYEGRLAGTPSENLDPPIYAPDFRRGTLSTADPDDEFRRDPLTAPIPDQAPAAPTRRERPETGRHHRTREATPRW
jgi:hypothetical protein